MTQAFALLLGFLVGAMGNALAQSGTQSQTLTASILELESGRSSKDPQWAAALDASSASASPEEIRQVFPRLVALTESPNARIRESAIVLIYSFTAREKGGLPDREQNLANARLLIPYISRLAPRLNDSSTPVRSLTLLLFASLALIRPMPPDLLTVSLNALQDPTSTQQGSDTNKIFNGKAPSIGPQVLWVLLPAGATFFSDPATGITEGRDSLEVRQAIIAFLRRPDQTTESLSESFRALAVAQPQNPDINAELLRFLDSPDPLIQAALLRSISRLTLTPQDFVAAKARVTKLAADPATSADVKQLATAILPCWKNDRHSGLCQQIGP